MFANSERLDKSDACDGAESLLVTQRYLAWHGDWLRSSITEEKKTNYTGISKWQGDRIVSLSLAPGKIMEEVVLKATSSHMGQKHKSLHSV